MHRSFVEGTKLSLGAMPDPLSKTAFAGDCQGSACELTVARDLAVHVAFDSFTTRPSISAWSTVAGVDRRLYHPPERHRCRHLGREQPARVLLGTAAMSDFNFGFASVSIAGTPTAGSWPATTRSPCRGRSVRSV